MVKKLEDFKELVDKERYQRLVRKLIYLFHIKFDIVFAVAVVSQHFHLSKKAHIEAVYKVLRKSLLSKRNKIKNREFFIDADWTSSIEDRCSNIGFCTLFFKNLVTREVKNKIL